MGRGGKDMFYKIFIFGVHTYNTTPPASLLTIGIGRHALDVARV